MVEVVDGREGWLARRGGSIIDVIRGWINDGVFGWNRLGGYGLEIRWLFSFLWGKGRSGRCCSRVGFLVWFRYVFCFVCVFWGFCMCEYVCECLCVFVYTYVYL